MKKKKISAFTLAEVLITIGIIGVIAAMTLPTLIGNYQKKITANKLKKIYSELTQAMSKSYADNGPATVFLKSSEIVNEETTKNFFETYWLPYFKSPIVAKSRFYKGEDTPYKSRNGNSYGISIYTDYQSGRILFKTQDGTIYFINIMSWGNKTNEDGTIMSIKKYSSAASIMADINGNSGPNMVGKDIFQFSINFSDNKITPSCANATITNINSNCSITSSGSCCAAKIMNDNWEIKSDYPW